MDKTVDSNNLCVVCNERPVENKKRKLCFRCYAKIRKQELKHGESIPLERIACPTTEQKYRTAREMEFIKQFFKHGQWFYEPCLFRLSNGTSYQPDFYDGARNVFIEVAGTRQEYSFNKDKYEQFKKDYPLISFEVRGTDGNLIEKYN